MKSREDDIKDSGGVTSLCSIPTFRQVPALISVLWPCNLPYILWLLGDAMAHPTLWIFSVSDPCTTERRLPSNFDVCVVDYVCPFRSAEAH